jgi:hypothetical protein
MDAAHRMELTLERAPQPGALLGINRFTEMK